MASSEDDRICTICGSEIEESNPDYICYNCQDVIEEEAWKEEQEGYDY